MEEEGQGYWADTIWSGVVALVLGKLEVDSKVDVSQCVHSGF